MSTLKEIYGAINPMPAMLAIKGKESPRVDFSIEANAQLTLMMRWNKPYSKNSWESEYKCFSGSDFSKMVDDALTFITKLPSAEQAKLHHFMGSLGKLIDDGRSEGINVDYLNPLLDTMKRLSENVITHRKEI